MRFKQFLEAGFGFAAPSDPNSYWKFPSTSYQGTMDNPGTSPFTTQFYRSNPKRQLEARAIDALSRLVEQATRAYKIYVGSGGQNNPQNKDLEDMRFFTHTNWPNVRIDQRCIYGLGLRDVRMGAKGGQSGGLQVDEFELCKQMKLLWENPQDPDSVVIDCVAGREAAHKYIGERSGGEYAARIFDRALNIVAQKLTASSAPMRQHPMITGGVG